MRPCRRFQTLVTELHRRVPSLQVRAASMVTDGVPSWMTEHRLLEPLRTPPFLTSIVQHMISASSIINTYRPSSRALPADGPRPIELLHTPESGGHVQVGQGREPCGQCAVDVSQVLIAQLNVGESSSMVPSESTILFKVYALSSLPSARILVMDMAYIYLKSLISCHPHPHGLVISNG
jgi:hypothetical protein